MFIPVLLLLAQSVPDTTTRLNVGVVDSSGATRTAPNKTGTSLPGTCTVGDTYFKSDATAGSNVYGCTSTNTWTAQGGGGSSTSYWYHAFKTAFTLAGTYIPLGEYSLSDGVGATAFTNSGLLTYVTTFSKSTGTGTVYLSSILPTGYVAGSLKVEIMTRSHPRSPYGETASASGNVYVELQSTCLTPSDDASTETANTATHQTITISGDHKAVFSSTTIPDTSCSENNQVQVRVARLRSDGNDTFPNSWVVSTMRLVAQVSQ